MSDAYLSPCFRCGPGSSHGYDVTDHNAFNPEIGGAAAFDRMAAALAARGLGLILDVVPNHMGIAGDANPWWLDVLENGRASPRAGFFDIDWTPFKPELRDRVLLPVLPDQYGRVLESQQLQLEFADGAFHLRYAGARLPIAPDTYAQILTDRLPVLAGRLGPGGRGAAQELRSILTALEHLPGRTETDPARLEERLREKEIVKRRLAALAKESAEIREHVEETVRAVNGVPGNPASFDALDRLLSAQTYRLADWRVAGDEVNYRRFFDVSHLAAIRMEQRVVFDAAHELVLRLVGEGKVTALRVDHPDGLYAPGEYFRRLQEGALVATARRLVPELGPAEAEALGALYRARAARAAGRRGGPAALDRGGEDPESGRAPARLVGGCRHHRLRLPGLGQRALRGPRNVPADDLAVHAARRGGRAARRSHLRGQAPHHAGLDGERDQPARPSPRFHVRARSPLARLHPLRAWSA